jgi:hypothetical protein
MDNPANDSPRCVVCEDAQDAQPLLSFLFRGQTRWICARHLPILIHDPARLAARVPGTETLLPSKHEH